MRAPGVERRGRRDGSLGLVGRVMGGRHESPGPGNDIFMTLVLLALLVVLAAALIPALAGR